MKDVAERCGVSVKTVSRLVNGQGGTSQATADRVFQTIEQLGFRRNLLASNLRQTGHSSIVGVVIEDVSNPFYGTMIRAVEEYAHQKGLMVLSVSSDEDPAREHDLIRELIARQVAGLIIVTATADNSYLQSDTKRGLPVVFADRPGNGVECDEILLDNCQGARDAVEHLLRQGHRRIGVVADYDHVYTARVRVEGYLDALHAHGIQDIPDLIRLGCHSTEQAAEAVHELLALEEPPTAIFTTNNRSTAGAIRAIHSRDAQLGLVGFDDFEFADLLDPPVTVVWHDPAALGRAAAEQLFRRLDGSNGPVIRKTIPSRLVVRSSGVLRTRPLLAGQ
jgi:LacI family transcriptional regulator